MATAGLGLIQSYPVAGLGVANPAADKLQAAASRYGGVAGFGSVVPTSTFDDQTLQAVQQALIWIRDNAPGEYQNATGLIAQVTDLTTIQNSASGLTTYLNQVGDAVGLGGSNLNFAPGAKPSLLGLGLPSWVIYAAGIALAVGVVALIIRHQKLKGASLHPIGHYGYDDDDDDDVEDAEFQSYAATS